MAQTTRFQDVLDFPHMKQFSVSEVLFAMTISIDYLIRSGFRILYIESTNELVNLSGLLDIDNMKITIIT